jgi:hypothetical protein
MVEVSIQHIIGTVALIGLVISAGLFYAIFTSYVQDSIRKKDLEQISATVALNLEETINLIKFSKYSDDYSGNDYMIKIFDLPTDIDGRSYKIQLVNDSNRLYVHTYLSAQQSVSADSTIPYNSGDLILKFNTTDVVYSIVAGVDNLTIACSDTVYGKNSTVIWANLDWDYLTGLPTSVNVGIGWVKTRQ